jgi:photosystem II stability/assembly factor-like uncharacterized protein
MWFAAIEIGLPAQTPAATWKSLGPPAIVFSVAASENPNIVYITLKDSGVWKTSDGGLTWVQMSAGLPLPGNFSIVVDPFDSSVAYVSAGRVYKTVNGGESWLVASLGLPAGSSGPIVISRSQPASLLVSVAGALYRSHDAAASWQPVGAGLPSGTIEATFSPASSETVIIGVSGASAGLYRSRDGGSTWLRLPLPISSSSLKYVGPIAFDPQNPMVLYAGSRGCGFSCSSLLYKSHDGGATWSFAGLISSFLSAVAVDTSSAITASVYNPVYQSLDGGLTWTDFGDGLSNNAVTFLDRFQDRLYAATAQGVFQATVGAPPTMFHTIPPCRLSDTRDASGAYGGPALSSAMDRTFVVRGRCGIPNTARAVAFNFTITQPSALGDLRIYRQGHALPTASALNWKPGQTRANNAILNLGASGEIVIHVDQLTGSVHLVIDATGYFE